MTQNRSSAQPPIHSTNLGTALHFPFIGGDLFLAWHRQKVYRIPMNSLYRTSSDNTFLLQVLTATVVKEILNPVQTCGWSEYKMEIIYFRSILGLDLEFFCSLEDWVLYISIWLIQEYVFSTGCLTSCCVVIRCGGLHYLKKETENVCIVCAKLHCLNWSNLGLNRAVIAQKYY